MTILPLKYIFGLKIVVKGKENLRTKEPFVLVLNHQTSLDIMRKSIIQILPKVETFGLGPDDVPKLTEQVRDSMLTTYQEISGMTNKASH
ncbi:hypothetical protein AV530_011005 [Patagioenas fasciata monilis]|uniref:Phospholipid/glycerol acyltransferase domain-containing protein n=1 Tax=Patagioenas fasciata monilis TaxID=372326 RepID=A0A1V4K4L5_PATFA|nr:hypothetical protein AV530_011005 [Patagioenas fasciata monilis]